MTRYQQILESYEKLFSSTDFMVTAGFFPDETYAFVYDSVPSESVDKSILEYVKSVQKRDTIEIKNKKQAYGRFFRTLNIQVYFSANMHSEMCLPSGNTFLSPP